MPYCIWISYVKHGCIWRRIVKSFILPQNDTLTYFNNFLGFNEFDQICHKLSLLTGHHHSAPGMISSELERAKKTSHHIKQNPNLPNQYPKEKNPSETPGKTDTSAFLFQMALCSVCEPEIGLNLTVSKEDVVCVISSGYSKQ